MPEPDIYETRAAQPEQQNSNSVIPQFDNNQGQEVRTESNDEPPHHDEPQQPYHHHQQQQQDDSYVNEEHHDLKPQVTSQDSNALSSNISGTTNPTATTETDSIGQENKPREAISSGNNNSNGAASYQDNYEYDYDLGYRRPVKKRVVAGRQAAASAFSLRNRVDDDDQSNKGSIKVTDNNNNDDGKHHKEQNSTESIHNNNQTQLPSWLKKGKNQNPLAAAPSAAPSWMKPEDAESVTASSSSKSAASDKKFKRPKRRTNVEDQLKRAQEIRAREEEADRRNAEMQRRILQNNDDVVRSHYNQRAFQARKERRDESQIYKLRNFNNVIKYMLIGKFSKEGDKVLDLACGKGGDLFKWQKARASVYVGLDISPSSIKEAVSRYQSIKYRNFEAFFATGDAFGTSLGEALSVFPPDAIEWPMDMVSIQFALHYAFESEEKIRNTLANISRSMRVGGYFVGTIPSSDFIRHKVKGLKPGEKKWGNSIYSVEFVDTPPANGVFSPPYGNKYIYYLKDAVEYVPEYVVPFEAFRALAEEYDLELRYKKPFFELYMEEIPEWINKLSPKLLNGLKRSDGKLGLEGENKQAAEFYLAFAFEKTGYQ